MKNQLEESKEKGEKCGVVRRWGTGVGHRYFQLNCWYIKRNQGRRNRRTSTICFVKIIIITNIKRRIIYFRWEIIRNHKKGRKFVKKWVIIKKKQSKQKQTGNERHLSL